MNSKNEAWDRMDEKTRQQNIGQLINLIDGEPINHCTSLPLSECENILRRLLKNKCITSKEVFLKKYGDRAILGADFPDQRRAFLRLIEEMTEE